MSDERMPPGRYLSTPLDVGVDYGGQTRATLVRNRLLAERFGLRPEVLTFNPRPSWSQRLDDLRESGLLLPGTPVTNLYDAHATTGWGEHPVEEPATPLLTPTMRRETELRPDGSPWRHVHTEPDGSPEGGTVVHEYLRADGTPYLRVPRFAYRFSRTWPRSLERVGRDGEPRGTFDSYASWVRRWVLEVTAGDPTFLFIDSRSLGMHLLPLRAPHVHTVFVLHGVHVAPPYAWTSRLVRDSRAVLRQLPAMDALVVQTRRQLDDLALRYGEAPQLAVAPNAVDAPTEPPPVPRDPHRLITVCRLMPGKGLLDAVAVVDRVRARVPQVHLDVYGEGPERELLERAVAERGLERHVTLHGHDPAAKEHLWTAAAALMTSESETWNMSIQEAMSHGCPVVAYDIKYGPREQVTDGSDGLLVPHGDVDAMAAAVLRLLTDADEARRLGEAARLATATSVQRFEDDWVEVLRLAQRTKRRRVDLSRVEAQLTGLRLRRRWGRDHDALTTGELTVRERGRVEVEVAVDVRAKRPQVLDEARWRLLAVGEDSEHHVEVPLQAQRDDSRVTLTGEVAAASLTAALPAGAAYLRLSMVCRNHVWSRDLDVPGASPQERVRLLIEG
ncbi:glycosyltransferase [Nocardioides aequoreus]|uniref:glycosyltransferase n=1 Tax=Nocardioides aequoreus TaxID=397278 RepID=UPI00068E041E|nr:glycosyltransferase [Nocardioides aequoreus]